ncbi:MAG: tetratricopeptide repeat protein [Candidatus Obscuribacterales bacterium]|nr:tetratricopeptide repeat protein [Candidatus Obscuribacterales bacterium]
MYLNRFIALAVLFSLVFPFLAITAADAAPPVDPAAIERRKVKIHRSLLNIYLAQKRKPEAIGEFKSLLALKPSDSKLHYEYGVFLAQHGDNNSAIQQLKAAQEGDPTSADINGALGTTYLRVKNVSAALEYLQKAAGKDPERYKKTYEDAYKYIQIQNQRAAMKKRQAQQKIKYDEQKQKAKTDDDEDDW